MNSYNDQAIILRRYPIGEADYVLVVFSKNHGKMNVVAKGVRRISSRRAGHLDLFNLVSLQINARGGGMGIVTEVESLVNLERAKKDPRKLLLLYRTAEILERLLAEEDKQYALFTKTVTLFEQIETSPTGNKLESDVLRYEIEILTILGYWSDVVQGKEYPSTIRERFEHHDRIIEEIIQRTLNSGRVLGKSFRVE